MAQQIQHNNMDDLRDQHRSIGNDFFDLCLTIVESIKIQEGRQFGIGFRNSTSNNKDKSKNDTTDAISRLDENSTQMNVIKENITKMEVIVFDMICHIYKVILINVLVNHDIHRWLMLTKWTINF